MAIVGGGGPVNLVSLGLMPRRIRAIGILWALVGIALVAWAIWGLIVEEHYRSVVETWLIALAYGVLAVVGGMSVALAALGRVLMRIISVLGLLYIAAYIVFGGFDDAPGYVPWLLAWAALSVATLMVTAKSKWHAA